MQGRSKHGKFYLQSDRILDELLFIGQINMQVLVRPIDELRPENHTTSDMQKYLYKLGVSYFINTGVVINASVDAVNCRRNRQRNLKLHIQLPSWRRSVKSCRCGASIVDYIKCDSHKQGVGLDSYKVIFHKPF